MNRKRELLVARQSIPVRGVFRISRGARTAAEVIVAVIREDGLWGRGEATPYRRYGESLDSVAHQMFAMRGEIRAGIGREDLMEAMPGGAARNALDAALWDLEAQQTGHAVHDLAGEPPVPLIDTAYTLSLDTPEAMAEKARAYAGYPLLKLKAGSDGDTELARIEAVRDAAPEPKMIVDANEAWTPEMVSRFGAALSDLRVDLLEQPLPAGHDGSLRGLRYPVPLGADESFHGMEDVGALHDRYQVVNIKLDKTGGLTAALQVREAARKAGYRVMVGCMVGSALAMAPARIAAAGADFADLDGPLMLDVMREGQLTYDEWRVGDGAPGFWGDGKPRPANADPFEDLRIRP